MSEARIETTGSYTTRKFRKAKCLLSRTQLTRRLHPADARLEALPHLIRRQVRASAVPRENPFEVVIQQALHGFGLLRPRVPGDITKRRQPAAIVGPREMVAREQELVPV